MIHKKNIFLIFFGAVFLLLIAAAAYFVAREIAKNNSQPEDSQFAEKQKAAVVAETKEQALSDSEKIVIEYPLERGVGGVLKSVDAEQGVIVISGDNEQRVAIVATTEIFRGGKRASLADIKSTDYVAVLGREKTKDSEILIADSIYANEDAEAPVPIQ